MERLLENTKNELVNIRGHYSIVMIDIDFFIKYCIRFTKEQVDKIMNNMTLFFYDVFPEEILFFERNGDELAIILKGMTNEQTVTMVQNALYKFKKQKFAYHCGEEYQTLNMTFSAGIASFPENGEGSIAIKKAVTALFLAKSLRRNHVVFYNDTVVENHGRILYNPLLKVETMAGNWGKTGTVKFAVPQKKCFLWEPQAIAVDEKGYVYIADQNNHQILCCKDNYIYPIAGNRQYGYSGDGEEADAAKLNKPTGLYVSHDKLLITDTGNDAVRLVDLTTNTITTICGTGQAGYSGDGDSAKNARLNKPGGIVMDQNQNIYINDIANNVIRKIDENGMITTFAGTGEFGFGGDGQSAKKACFNEIYGIGIDTKQENLYIVDYFSHRIRKIDLKTELITTVAGNGRPGYSGDGGNPLEAELNRPTAVCLDHKNNLYIGESGNNCVRVVIAEENKIYTMAGGIGPGTGIDEEIEYFRLANPNGLAFYHNTLYILDGANNRLCKITANDMGE